MYLKTAKISPHFLSLSGNYDRYDSIVVNLTTAYFNHIFYTFVVIATATFHRCQFSSIELNRRSKFECNVFEDSNIFSPFLVIVTATIALLSI